jgi:CheY-like chemotaxis protein
MDINMPIMDGYTATQQIRDTGAFNDLPIVAFTALVLDSEVEKMYNVGINAFLDKPLNIGKLYTVFEIYMNSKGSRDTRRTITTSTPPQVDAINIKEGIKHTNGNEALYMELLNEFINTYENSDELFEKLLKEHRYEQIKMLCLDMKGLAGAIGAEDMYQKVDEIHKLFIYNDKQLLGGYLKDYKLEIKRLGKSISRYLDANRYS